MYFFSLKKFSTLSNTKKNYLNEFLWVEFKIQILQNEIGFILSTEKQITLCFMHALLSEGVLDKHMRQVSSQPLEIAIRYSKSHLSQSQKIVRIILG